ncbi:hypothetical protein [Pedobacter lusitanus]|uniref:hypothetical protein n=1 Tax=Pedobacter lusitanus TaxID=1503925 RepID=UPI0006970E89|nr:hypothetical protein [Pedobacter lusitanus]
MIKSYTLIATLLCGYSSYAQNTFPLQGGNVGIGTSNPNSSLSIRSGNTGVSIHPGNNPAYFGTMAFNRESGTGEIFDPSGNAFQINNGGGDKNLHFQIYQGSGAMVTNNALVIAGATGNVGIGTDSPNSLLSIRNAKTGVSIHPGNAPYFGTLAFNRESATGEIFDPAGNAFQINNGGPDKNMHFVVFNGSGGLINEHALVISGATGNVGIGTNNPTEALSVNGNIRSKEIKVEAENWPDYVFKPDYQLPSLADVKTYIDKNQRLPDMPSEHEVAKQGVQLGEMNKLLVKKIEELTLYLIDLKSENEQIKKDQQRMLKIIEDKLN